MKSTKHRTARGCRTVIVALAGATLATPVAAQDVFEEIVVRAQKRDENIMDVPIAVTAVTGAEIEDAGIKDMFDLQQYVPGLLVGQSQTTTTSNFSIRGVGSTSNNFGVESSVGLYVDGVYRSRQSSLINELIDVEAVEVLRGPQGTLFGKNTPAGAIQIRTVAPSTDGPDGMLELTAGDYGLARLAGATNIVLGDDLAFRGTVFASQRDGYVSDDTFGSDVLNDRDRIGFRLQLGYEPSSDFNLRVIADYAELDEICCAAVARVDGLFSRASVAAGMPQNGSDAAIVALGGTVFTDYAYPSQLLAALDPLPGNVVTGVGYDDFRVAYNQLPESRNEDRGLSVEFNKTFDNELILTSITAFRAFDTYDDIDADFTDVDLIQRINDAGQQSVSQELRLAGEFGNGSNWVTGLYYFGQEIDSDTTTNGGPMLQPYLLLTQPLLGTLIAGVNQLSAATGGAIPPAAAPFPADVFSHDDITQDQDAWAVFGQVDFALSDRFILTVGGRYTDETKKMDAVYTQTAQGPPPDLNAIATNLFLAGQGMPFDPVPILAVAEPNAGWGSYLFQPLAPRPDQNVSQSDDQVSGTVKLSFFPNDTHLVYASFSTGYKSGGTNTERISPAFDSVFGPETSESLEVGYKGFLGPVRLSVALYDTNYDDFQAQSFTGTGFNLQNAGELETLGAEVEMLWRPFDSFEVQAFYAFNEGEYTEFEGGTCWDTAVFHTGQPDPGSNGDVNAEVCNRTGFPVGYNPEDRAYVALTKDFPIGDNELYIRGEYTWASEQFTDGDLDPFTIQDDIGLVNLRLGMHIQRWNSDVTVWGRNLTDERWYAGSFDAPIQVGRMNSYPQEPATYGITLNVQFD
ncbi:MAG TPA: TonB-dependent receptor [Woeseiaceae bacterium]|nr:TonB-dependent receptor [Woeseiaceae bacterium]